MHADHREYRELTAKLSDGMLSTEDSLRLNELLKSDPIAQQAYLDHMFMDGLLAREFGDGSPDSAVNSQVKELARNLPLPGTEPVIRPAERGSRLKKAGWSVAALVACLVAALFVVQGDHLLTTSRTPVSVPLVLADAGFESRTLNDRALQLEGGWFGSQVEIVGQHSGVDPLEGKQMLHWGEPANSDSNPRAVYQLVDLEEEAQLDIENRPSVFASANFNTSVQDDGDQEMYGVQIYAFSEKPIQVPGADPSEWGSPLAIVDRQLAADFDDDSWQNVSAQLSLPAETRYLVIQLSVVNPDAETDDDSSEHFVDKVSLSLVSSP